MKHPAVFLVLANFLLASALAQDKSYSGINLYGQQSGPSHVNGYFRPNDIGKVKYPAESYTQGPTQRPSTTPSAYLPPQYHNYYAQQHPQVIIRPITPQTTTPTPETYTSPPSESPPKDSCSCVPLDKCTIENMDFSFAVACKHGQVRCCSSPEVFRQPTILQGPRPPVSPPSTTTTTTTTTSTTTTPSTTTTTTTPTPPAKPVMATILPMQQQYSCKCTLAQECPIYAQRRGTCPPNLVTCCVVAEQSLGYAASFQPIDLPFQKVPNASHPVPAWEAGFTPVASSSNMLPAVIRPESRPVPEHYSHIQGTPRPTSETPSSFSKPFFPTQGPWSSGTPRPVTESSTPLPQMPPVQAYPGPNRPPFLPQTHPWPNSQQQAPNPSNPIPVPNHQYPQYPPNYGPVSVYGSQYHVANSPYLQRPTPPPHQSYYQPNPYLTRPQESQRPEATTQSSGLLSSLLSLFS